MKILLILPSFYILLISCGNNDDREEQSNAVKILPMKQPDSLVGKWNTSSTIFSTATLILELDGTFKYCTESCLSCTYSEGKWKHVQDLIELNSFDQYKNTSNKLAFPSRKDTVKIYLQHARFILDKDSLRHIGNDDRFDHSAFYKERKNVLQ